MIPAAPAGGSIDHPPAPPAARRDQPDPDGFRLALDRAGRSSRDEGVEHDVEDRKRDRRDVDEPGPDLSLAVPPVGPAPEHVRSPATITGPAAAASAAEPPAAEPPAAGPAAGAAAAAPRVVVPTSAPGVGGLLDVRTAAARTTLDGPEPAGSVGVPDAALPPPAPLTPLERAIHDLIDRFSHPVEDEPTAPISIAGLGGFARGPEPLPIAVRTSGAADPRPASGTPVAAEPPLTASPSHLRLVVGEDAERVIIAVRVRGDNVTVSLSAADDAVAARLARNAPALADAIRGRGLELANLSTGERDRRGRRDRAQPERPPWRGPTSTFRVIV